MGKKDLTQYSDDELSLWVFNEEYLYNLRHSSMLKEILEERFKFTNEQWKTLQDDLISDPEEREKWNLVHIRR